MGILRKLFIIALSISAIVEKSLAERREVRLTDEFVGPLALIKHEDNSLKAAVPHNYNPDRNSISYYYNDSEEEFRTACPARTRPEWKIEKEWNKNRDILSTAGSLLFLGSKDEPEFYCGVIPKPSIKKTNEQCNDFGDKFYEVGYPVKTDVQVQDIKFITTYKICYSITKGTLYSFHRIDSPSLLLLNVEDFYSKERKHSSELDKDFNTKLKEYGKKYFLYELAGMEDMPNKYYQNSTSFLFNFVPIPKNEEILKGMIRIDNFVRLLSKSTKKQLTLYSGTYEYEKSVVKTIVKYFKEEERNVKITIKSIWRIIMDTEQNSVITVTQFTQELCDKSDYICPKSFIMLKQYVNGGCSYACPLNNEIINLLGVPSTLQYSGSLLQGFPQTLEKEIEVEAEKKEGSSVVDEPSSSKLNVNILDFMNYQFFDDALKMVDPALRQIIQNDMPKNQSADEKRLSYLEASKHGDEDNGTFRVVDPGIDIL